MCEVVSPLTHDYHGDVLTITAGDEKIQATGNHPFWVVSGENLDSRPAPADVYPHEKGLTARGRWVEARSLCVGDELATRDGKTAKVGGISVRFASAKVYNLHVAGLHTYSVGAIGLLVHNKAMENKNILGGAEPNISIEKQLAGKGQLKDLRSNPNLKGVDINSLLRKTPKELEKMLNDGAVDQKTFKQIKKAFEGRDLGKRG